MASEEDIMDHSFDEDSILERAKIRTFVVSSIDNRIQIHVNALELKDLNIEELAKRINWKSLEHDQQPIIDISKLTKDLTIDQIKQQSIKVLNLAIDASLLSYNYSGNSRNISEINEDMNQDSEDESFGLKSRKKYENYLKIKYDILNLYLQTPELQ